MGSGGAQARSSLPAASRTGEIQLTLSEWCSGLTHMRCKNPTIHTLGPKMKQLTQSCSAQYSTIQTVAVHLEYLPEQSSDPAAQTAAQPRTRHLHTQHTTHRQDTFSDWCSGLTTTWVQPSHPSPLASTLVRRLTDIANFLEGQAPAPRVHSLSTRSTEVQAVLCSSTQPTCNTP